MKLSEAKKSLKGVFQGALKNLVSLADDSTLDKYLKPIKVGDSTTPIEVSNTDVKIRGTLDAQTINVKGDSVLTENTPHAGTIIGYTRLENDLTSSITFEIQDALTVEDSTHQITFKTPPSENVEIEATFFINILSTDTRISVGLSDSSTYNAVAAHLEYDANSVYFSDDEADDSVITLKWILVAGQLANVGISNTFYVGFSTDGATKSAYLAYGLRAATGACEHPFVIKATALPATIYDGQ
tara:strand:+ start:745 stop:1470 length:726 start_codon:yes stop_codon:yes gene_type:complete